MTVDTAKRSFGISLVLASLIVSYVTFTVALRVLAVVADGVRAQ